MPFSTTYSRTKTFANGGSLLPSDLNNIQDDLGNQIAVANVAGGFNEGGNVRRGKSIIATEESRTNTAYGLLTTPDRVQNVLLPTDGLICVAYQALWKESVASAGRAAIFIGANDLKLPNFGSATINTGTPPSAWIGGTANTYQPLSTIAAGLRCAVGGTGVGGSDSTLGVTTGVALSSAQNTGSELVYDGGVCLIYAAAGTYDISIQFKSTSGSVSAKERKLWVWTINF